MQSSSTTSENFNLAIASSLDNLPSSTLIVTTTSDSGAGSLRQAILDANASPGLDLITFNLGNGTQTIQLLSALPSITDAIILDGTTQPGFTGTPLIELDGSNAGADADGLKITAGSSLVRGLVITHFRGDGIELSGGGDHQIEGNYIGVSGSGTVDQGNSGSGIFIHHSSNNLIGGVTPGQGNLIAGNNGSGIRIEGVEASGNQVLGNWIGVDVSGDRALGNGQEGILISAPNNVIGGAIAGSGNVISGNQIGITLQDNPGTGNLIQGNRIGTDASGTAPLGNAFAGILVFSANNIIGGNTPETRNLISGNSGIGIALGGTNTTGNQILGNWIGTDITGSIDLGNALIGIDISAGATQNSIGGANPGDGNAIAFNGMSGIAVRGSDSTGNRLLGNTVFANQDAAIDLAQDGETANDAGDSDTGANDLQNFPLLTQALISDGTTAIAGTLNSSANRSFRIEFFTTSPSNATYLGFTETSTDNAGNSQFSFTAPVDLLGQQINATATEITSGNTSELSDSIGTLPLVSLEAIAPTATEATPAIPGIFRITRGTSSGSLTVKLKRDASSTATSSDYTLSDPLTLTIPDGKRFVDIALTPVDDLDPELAETLTLTLLENDNYGIDAARNSATITLQPSDLPLITISDGAIAESTNGSASLNFTVSLSEPGTQPISLDYSTGDGTAIADNDYTRISGTLIILPGQTSQILSVPILDDFRDEPNETFSLNLSDPSNALLQDSQGTGTILDNDTAGLSLSPLNDTPDESGSSASFTLQLTSAPTAPVTVTLTNPDSTEIALSTPTLRFTDADWNIPQTITVTGIDDPIPDGDSATNLTLTTSSPDPSYSNLSPIHLSVTNRDNDSITRQGTRRADRLRGTRQRDVIDGLRGNDQIQGLADADTLLGNQGNDLLTGGAGNDTLIGGQGRDTLIGGGGRDGFILSSGTGTDLMRDFRKGQDFFGLVNGLSFADLHFVNGSNGVQIRLNSSNELLAIASNLRANQLTASHFISV